MVCNDIYSVRRPRRSTVAAGAFTQTAGSAAPATPTLVSVSQQCLRAGTSWKRWGSCLQTPGAHRCLQPAPLVPLLQARADA